MQLDQEFWPDDQNDWNFLASLSSTERGSFGLLSGASQTFTVGIAGLLDSVQVYVDGELGNEDPRRVPTLMRILQTNDGIPIGGLDGSVSLASSTSVVSDGPSHIFDLSESNFSVDVGDVFAIELFGLQGEIGTVGFWGGKSGASVEPFIRRDYEGGERFGYNDRSRVDPNFADEFPDLDTTKWRSAQPSEDLGARHRDMFFRTFIAPANPTAVPEPSSVFAFALVAIIPWLKLRNQRRKP